MFLIYEDASLQQINIFEFYKPFRDYLEQFPLLGSLDLIWCFCRELYQNKQYILNFSPLSRSGTLVKPECGICIWELDILTKELILNARGESRRSLVRRNDLCHAINFIRSIENEITKLQGQDKMFKLLHRYMHQQLPWQRSLGVETIMRYYFIFNDSELNQMMKQQLGLTIQQFYLMGLAISGHFLNKSGMSTSQDYFHFGVDAECRDIFFKLVSTDLDSLRQEIEKEQRYDEAWACTFNPLQKTPLIIFDPMYPNRVVCPFPHYLIKRVSEGLFYDLVGKAGFDKAYGDAYQKYVGKVLERACPSPQFKVTGEEKYHVGKSLKHGVDWILKDDTGIICIECKTKRLQWGARFDSESERFSNDLAKMAGFIVQTYKNIEDIRTGKINIQYEGLPIYPTIITLEDWLPFNPVISKELNEEVHKLLVEEGIDQKVIREMPYSIISIADAEDVFQFINQMSIEPYARSNLDREHPIWPISRASARRDENFRPKALFSNEFDDMLMLLGSVQQGV